jgi:hypothetical protein
MKETQTKSLVDLTLAINDCLDKQQIMPCLIMLYSGLEIVARMGSQPGETTRRYFMRWVETYILHKAEYEVTAIELYAARCGVLHAFSPDSDLFKNGKARRIAYSWGTASVDKLRDSIKTTSHDLAALHLNTFVRAFMNGIADFMDDLEADPVAQKRAEEIRDEWFSQIPISTVDSYLDIRIG